MRRNSHAATILVVVIAVAVLGFVLWRGDGARSEADSGSIEPSASSEATLDPTTAESSAPSPSPSVDLVNDELVQRSVQLVEQYLLLEPTDTPQVRQMRLEQYQVSAEIISSLDLTTGTLSCSDVARLDPANPLVQRADVIEESVTRMEYEDEAGETVAYLTVPLQLSLHSADGSIYDGGSCITTSLWTVGLTWVHAADDTWTLTSLVSPEGGSL